MSSGVLVAGRAGADGGVFRLESDRARRVIAVDGPVALAVHPRLPVLYAVTVGPGLAGSLHAWATDRPDPRPLGSPVAVGSEPCSVAVDPDGTLLAVAAYASSEVLAVPLGADGAPGQVSWRTHLTGGGPDPERQESAHPHQVRFVASGLLEVVDLGADLVRVLGCDDGRQRSALHVPAGAGPRHCAVWGRRRVVSAELSGSVLVSGPDGWQVVTATRRPGPARSRSARNYPGDVVVHPSAPVGYVANRGHDTVGVVDLVAGALVDEVDAGVTWPQHLLVSDDRLLVAGQDSSTVCAHRLDAADGRLVGEPSVVAQVPGACWLVRER